MTIYVRAEMSHVPRHGSQFFRGKKREKVLYLIKQYEMINKEYKQEQEL